MADTTYFVKVKYDLDTSGAVAGTNQLSGIFSRLTTLAAGFFSVSAVKGFVSRIIDLNVELETTRLRFAGMFNAAKFPGAQDFNFSLKMSSRFIEEIKQRSHSVAGTWQDIARIANLALIPGAFAHKSANQVLDLAARAQGVGNLLGMESEGTASSISQILQGRARATNPIFAAIRGFLPNMGEQWNKLSYETRFNDLQKALEKFNEALKGEASLFTTLKTTAKNYVEAVITGFGSGFFNNQKQGLKDLNEWFEKNRKSIAETAAIWGEKFASAVKKTKDVFVDIGKVLLEHKNIIITIAEVFAAFKVANMVGGIGTSIGGALGGGGPAKGSLGAVGKGAGLGFALAQLTGQTDFASTALLTFSGALSGLPGPVGAIATAFTIAEAALMGFIKWLDDSKKEDIKRQGDFQSLADSIFVNRDVGALFSRAREAGALEEQGPTVAGNPIAAFLNEEKFAAYLKSGGIDAKESFHLAQLAKHQVESMDYLDAFRRLHPRDTVEEAKINAKLNAPATGVGKGEMNVNVKIEQTINDATDPERVLLKTREAIDQSLHSSIQTAGNKFATLGVL